MENLVWILGGLAIGLILGYNIAIWVGRKTPVGTLRVDHSDPTEAPYLFLEMEPGGMDEIRRAKTVLFKVDLNGYLSRK